MNLVRIRERATLRQQAVHQNRAFHRERQKECEREDQALKAAIRSINDLLSAQAKFGAAMQELPSAVLEDLTEEKSVRSREPEVIDLVEAVEEITPAPDVVEQEVADASRAAAQDRDPVDSVYAGLIAEAVNDYAAIDMARFAARAGISIGTLRRRIDSLLKDGRLGKVKSRFPEPGWSTYRILTPAAQAAE